VLIKTIKACEFRESGHNVTHLTKFVEIEKVTPRQLGSAVPGAEPESQAMIRECQEGKAKGAKAKSQGQANSGESQEQRAKRAKTISQCREQHQKPSRKPRV